MISSQKAFIFGAILMLLAVALGAFGTHAFNQVLISNGRANVFDIANKYHFYHGLGLLIVGVILDQKKRFKYANIIVNLLFYGIILFSGSLYLLAITNMSYLGVITPIGGLFMLIAWFLLIVSLKSSSNC